MQSSQHIDCAIIKKMLINFALESDFFIQLSNLCFRGYYFWSRILVIT